MTIRSVVAGLVAAALAAGTSALAEAPAVLADYLKPDAAVAGEVVAVVPPKELQKYMDQVQEAAKANPDWYIEYDKQKKPGVPLPYHENLGLTKEEYADYLALWDQREFKPVRDGKVSLRLESPDENEWRITANGIAFPIALLRYDPAKDVMRSPNGVMNRLTDIDTTEKSLLGAWTGHEWKFEEKTSISSLKENFAIGVRKDRDFGIIIYRIREVSSAGTLLLDKRLVIRFPVPKGTE